MENKITIVQRGYDLMAYINENEALWGCGPTIQEAIGSVIRNHPEILGLKIEYPKTINWNLIKK